MLLTVVFLDTILCIVLDYLLPLLTFSLRMVLSKFMSSNQVLQIHVWLVLFIVWRFRLKTNLELGENLRCVGYINYLHSIAVHYQLKQSNTSIATSWRRSTLLEKIIHICLFNHSTHKMAYGLFGGKSIINISENV